ncbi:hypothetical protein VPH35_013046 [Triticum aestivum]
MGAWSSTSSSLPTLVQPVFSTRSGGRVGETAGRSSSSPPTTAIPQYSLPASKMWPGQGRLLLSSVASNEELHHRGTTCVLYLRPAALLCWDEAVFVCSTPCPTSTFLSYLVLYK